MGNETQQKTIYIQDVPEKSSPFPGSPCGETPCKFIILSYLRDTLIPWERCHLCLPLLPGQLLYNRFNHIACIAHRYYRAKKQIYSLFRLEYTYSDYFVRPSVQYESYIAPIAPRGTNVSELPAGAQLQRAWPVAANDC